MPSLLKKVVSRHWLVVRLLFFSLPTLAALFTFALQPALAQDAPTDVPATYLVQFQPNISEAERTAWIARQGAELVAWMPQINVAELRPSANSSGDLTAAADDAAAVVYSEPDAPVWAARAITEPAFSNSNQSYAQKLLRISAAWDITDGSNSIVIAIVDTGIDSAHPELTGRLTAGYDYVNNDDDADDDNGHGTHVAGIVAAGLNGVGMVGVCPQCKLMPIKVLNANNSGSMGTVAKGILYAVDHGAKVINLSLGSAYNSVTVENAVAYAQEHNVVVVAAAGNQSSDAPFYPASLPYVIAVGGTDQNDAHWIMSNTGDFIDMTAPAVAIYSAYYDKATGSSTYAYMSGTSMSTAFVSGLAALALSRCPNATNAEVLDLITEGAIDLGASGKDPEYGYGRTDAYNTLLAANDGVVPVIDVPEEPGGDENDGGDADGDGGGDSSTPPTNNLYLPTIVAH